MEVGRAGSTNFYTCAIILFVPNTTMYYTILVYAIVITPMLKISFIDSIIQSFLR